MSLSKRCLFFTFLLLAQDLIAVSATVDHFTHVREKMSAAKHDSLLSRVQQFKELLLNNQHQEKIAQEEQNREEPVPHPSITRIDFSRFLRNSKALKHENQDSSFDRSSFNPPTSDPLLEEDDDDNNDNHSDDDNRNGNRNENLNFNLNQAKNVINYGLNHTIPTIISLSVRHHLVDMLKNLPMESAIPVFGFMMLAFISLVCLIVLIVNRKQVRNLVFLIIVCIVLIIASFACTFVTLYPDTINSNSDYIKRTQDRLSKYSKIFKLDFLKLLVGTVPVDTVTLSSQDSFRIYYWIIAASILLISLTQVLIAFFSNFAKSGWAILIDFILSLLFTTVLIVPQIFHILMAESVNPRYVTESIRLGFVFLISEIVSFIIPTTFFLIKELISAQRFSLLWLFVSVTYLIFAALMAYFVYLIFSKISDEMLAKSYLRLVIAIVFALFSSIEIFSMFKTRVLHFTPMYDFHIPDSCRADPCSCSHSIRNWIQRPIVSMCMRSVCDSSKSAQTSLNKKLLQFAKCQNEHVVFRSFEWLIYVAFYAVFVVGSIYSVLKDSNLVDPINSNESDNHELPSSPLVQLIGIIFVLVILLRVFFFLHKGYQALVSHYTAQNVTNFFIEAAHLISILILLCPAVVNPKYALFNYGHADAKVQKGYVFVTVMFVILMLYKVLAAYFTSPAEHFGGIGISKQIDSCTDKEKFVLWNIRDYLEKKIPAVPKLDLDKLKNSTVGVPLIDSDKGQHQSTVKLGEIRESTVGGLSSIDSVKSMDDSGESVSTGDSVDSELLKKIQEIQTSENPIQTLQEIVKINGEQFSTEIKTKINEFMQVTGNSAKIIIDQIKTHLGPSIEEPDSGKTKILAIIKTEEASKKPIETLQEIVKINGEQSNLFSGSIETQIAAYNKDANEFLVKIRKELELELNKKIPAVNAPSSETEKLKSTPLFPSVPGLAKAFSIYETICQEKGDAENSCVLRKELTTPERQVCRSIEYNTAKLVLMIEMGGHKRDQSTKDEDISEKKLGLHKKAKEEYEKLKESFKMYQTDDPLAIPYFYPKLVESFEDTSVFGIGSIFDEKCEFKSEDWKGDLAGAKTRLKNYAIWNSINLDLELPGKISKVYFEQKTETVGFGVDHLLYLLSGESKKFCTPNLFEEKFLMSKKHEETRKFEFFSNIANLFMAGGILAYQLIIAESYASTESSN